MEIINFEDGALVTPAKVIIDGVEYEVIPAVRQGNTPLSAHILNRMQDNIKSAVNENAEEIENTKTQLNKLEDNMQNEFSNREKTLTNNGSVHCNGTSQTYELKSLKQYLLVCSNYGNGNVYPNQTYVAIISTGVSENKTSQITNISGDVANLITVEFIDGLTVKITALSSKWTITSLTEL